MNASPPAPAAGWSVPRMALLALLLTWVQVVLVVTVGVMRVAKAALAAATVQLLPRGARVLTHCWMDTYLVELVQIGRAHV